MAHPLGYSLLEENPTHKVSSRNKTIRKKRSGDVNSKKVTQFLNFMKDSNDTDITGKGANSNIHEASLADYDSLLPKMTNMPEDKKDVGYPNKNNKVSAFDEDEDDDVEITNEGLDGWIKVVKLKNPPPASYPLPFLLFMGVLNV